MSVIVNSSRETSWCEEKRQVPWVWSQLCHNRKTGLWASYSMALWLVNMFSNVSFNPKALLSYPPPIPSDIAALSQLQRSWNLSPLIQSNGSTEQWCANAAWCSSTLLRVRASQRCAQRTQRLPWSPRGPRATERQEWLRVSQIWFINLLSPLPLLIVWAWYIA